MNALFMTVSRVRRVRLRQGAPGKEPGSRAAACQKPMSARATSGCSCARPAAGAVNATRSHIVHNGVPVQVVIIPRS